MNWLCSQPSADRSIIARAALSWLLVSVLAKVRGRVTYEFVVLDVQEDKFWPEMSTLRCLDHLRDVDARDKEL